MTVGKVFAGIVGFTAAVLTIAIAIAEHFGYGF